MSAITAKASRKMKKYAVLTREPRCFLGSFDLSWEQRKFEEIAVRSSVICSDDTLPRVEYEDIVSGTGRLNKDIYAKQSSKSGIVFHQGDVLYGKLRPYLQNWLLPTFDGLAVGDFWVLQPQNADSSFLYRLIQSRQFDEVANQSTGTKMPRADWKLVSKTVFSIPSNISEQAAIGTYFTALDSLITLHQRKCALLFSPFQSFISMMFTTSTFSWEQRKFSELYEKVSRKNDLTYGKDDIISVANMYFKADSYITDESYLLTYNIFELGDIAFEGNKSKNYAHGRFVENTIGNGIVSHVFDVFKPIMKPYDLQFWKYAINNEQLMGGILLRSTKASTMMTNLVANDFLQETFLVPAYPEQQKIGAFFQELDRLITLHQRKCIFFTGRAGRLISTVNKKRITSSWEQRKLSEMCGTFEYGLNAAAKEFDGKNKYIRITDIDDASREFLLSDLSSPDICLDGMSKYLLSSGDIVFARTGASVGKTYIYRENDGIVYFAGFLIRAKVNQDNDAEFVFQSTLSPSYEKYIRITSQRSGQPGVNAQEYGEYDLFAPSKEEQQRIGHFLRGIDNLITLHQRKPFLMKWRTSDANRNQTNRLVL